MTYYGENITHHHDKCTQINISMWKENIVWSLISISIQWYTINIYEYSIVFFLSVAQVIPMTIIYNSDKSVLIGPLTIAILPIDVNTV